MIDASARLLYYKRREVQSAILESCRQKEVGIRYGDNGYGKRPDSLFYENDVFEPVKKGATSFHVSEERWNNAMNLSTEMRKEDLDSLRAGWDLVIDIDCPYWVFSKLSSHLFVRALKLHNISSIGCKFSGNKGFHIGVPFEAFPEIVNNMLVKNIFPEGPKKIALYLVDYIANNLIDVKPSEVIFDGRFKTSIEKISQITKKTRKELSKLICLDCKKSYPLNESTFEFICPKCSFRVLKNEGLKMLLCERCNSIMEKVEYKSICSCGSKKEPKEIFDPLSIINVDTLLISSRHMYRTPYSMHEKSGLVSIPINPDDILHFEKKFAEPSKVKTSLVFLNASAAKKDEARNLMVNALDYGKQDIIYKDISEKIDLNKEKKFELPDKAIPIDFFPPSIKKGLSGLEDGKKRFLFVLVNFLLTCGWNYSQIESLVFEWNKKNHEPLRGNYIQGQLRYIKIKPKIVPPPNYDTGIYRELGIPDTEEIMRKYKNPVAYAKILYLQNKKEKKSWRLTDEQREMRKLYREKLKKERKGKEDNEDKKKGF